MSEKFLNDETNNGVKRKQTITDNRYDTMFKYNHQPKRVFRANYIQNSEHTTLSKNVTSPFENPTAKYHCSTSTSSAKQCATQCLDDDQTIDTTAVKKNTLLIKKGKKSLICQIVLKT